MEDKQDKQVLHNTHVPRRRPTLTSNHAMFLVMLWSAVFRRRSRAFMAVVATMVGAATLFCLTAVCVVVPQQINEEMRAYGANIIVTPLEGEWKNGIDRPMVLHTNDMVLAKGAMRTATYRYENVRIHAAPYVLAGVDTKQVRSLNKHWNVDGAWPSRGNVMVGSDVAHAMGLKIGSRISIAYRAGDNMNSHHARTLTRETSRETMREGRVSTDILDAGGTKLRVGGILQTGGPEDGMVYADNADVNTLTGVKRGVDLIAYSSSAPSVDEVVRSINEMTSMRVMAQKVTKITTANQGIITMLQSLFWIVSFVVLALMMVGVSTTISSIVSQRRNEIGLRKALGASAQSVILEFTLEAGLYGLIGGVLGTCFGYGFAWLLTTMVFARTADIQFWLMVCSIVVSIVAACVASLPPVLRASRIDPAVVLREE